MNQSIQRPVKNKVMTTAAMSTSGPMVPARLHPKEHGAYAIVGIPLLVALAIGGLNPVAVLTAVATIAGFIANEPLMILRGRRGERARVATPSAFLVLNLLLLTVVVCGGCAFWLGDQSIRAALLATLVFAAAGFALSAFGWQRTLTAQLTGIVGLTLPSAIVLLAGGIEIASVVQFTMAWIVGRIATTIAVRSVVALQKASTHHHVPVINDILLLLASIATVGGASIGVHEFLLVTPLIASAVYLRLQPPAIRHMRRIGFALLAANIVTAILIICVARFST